MAGSLRLCSAISANKFFQQLRDGERVTHCIQRLFQDIKNGTFELVPPEPGDDDEYDAKYCSGVGQAPVAQTSESAVSQISKSAALPAPDETSELASDPSAQHTRLGCGDPSPADHSLSAPDETSELSATDANLDPSIGPMGQAGSGSTQLPSPLSPFDETENPNQIENNP